LSWLQPGIQLTYRRYAVDWEVLEQLIITQVTDSTVKVKNRRRYISGWSLYPFQDRHLRTRTYTVDRQTGKATEAQIHSFYNRLWLHTIITEGDQIVFPIRQKNPSELIFTVTGQEMRTMNIHRIKCWCFEATYQNERYRFWHDCQYGLRIRFEAMTQTTQHNYSAHTVWQLQQLTQLSWDSALY
jgi:hypothetical protein